MRMIVVSDTHHDMTALRKLTEIINTCDYLVHLGDCNDDIRRLGNVFKPEVICVRGNCDFVCKNPVYVVKEINGIKYLFTHGHTLRVKDTLLDLALFANENGCRYAFYGHTHIAGEDEMYGVKMINPGSLGSPKFSYPSYLLVEEENGKIFTNILFIA